MTSVNRDEEHGDVYDPDVDEVQLDNEGDGGVPPDEEGEDYVVPSTPINNTGGALKIFGFVLAIAVVVLIPVAVFSGSTGNYNTKRASSPSGNSGKINVNDQSEKYKTIYNTITSSKAFALLKDGEEIYLTNPQSPQYKALHWLAYEDPSTFGDKTELLDRYALTVLYFSTNGPEWKNEGNWVTGKHTCEWEHVTCHLSHDDPNSKTNYVLSVEPEESNLVGTIPVELGLLTHMTKLDLSHNVLHGTIPSKILLSLASKLVEFYLKDNQLVGSIPTEIGLLTSMQYLSLAENYLSEQIPTHIGLLTNMKNLGLNNLDIDGHIPTEIGLCTSLEYINANSCDLSGTLPSELGLLNKLTTLRLSGNRIHGNLPPELFEATELVDLYLNDNELEGTIPGTVGNLQKLKDLGLSRNQLTGPIPPEGLGFMTSLQELYVFNNKLSSSIPTQIGLLFAGLRYFDAQENQLTGTIPTEVGKLSTLRHFYLSRNHLSGSLPSQLGLLSNMSKFRCDDNELTGSIPPLVGSMTSLESLQLGYNHLSGEITSAFCKTDATTGVSTVNVAKFPDLEELEADCASTSTTRSVNNVTTTSGGPEVDCDCCTKCYK